MRSGRDRREAVFYCMADVRYWHKADIPKLFDHRPLLGVKRTSRFKAAMSANGTKRTLCS